MNGNDMHGEENVIPCTAINILHLDEPLEYKNLFWLVAKWRRGTVLTLKFTVALQ